MGKATLVGRRSNDLVDEACGVLSVEGNALAVTTRTIDFDCHLTTDNMAISEIRQAILQNVPFFSTQISLDFKRNQPVAPRSRTAISGPSLLNAGG
jgi:hypothetical protein